MSPFQKFLLTSNFLFTFNGTSCFLRFLILSRQSRFQWLTINRQLRPTFRSSVMVVLMKIGWRRVGGLGNCLLCQRSTARGLQRRFRPR